MVYVSLAGRHKQANELARYHGSGCRLSNTRVVTLSKKGKRGRAREVERDGVGGVRGQGRFGGTGSIAEASRVDAAAALLARVVIEAAGGSSTCVGAVGGGCRDGGVRVVVVSRWRRLSRCEEVRGVVAVGRDAGGGTCVSRDVGIVSSKWDSKKEKRKELIYYEARAVRWRGSLETEMTWPPPSGSPHRLATKRKKTPPNFGGGSGGAALCLRIRRNVERKSGKEEVAENTNVKIFMELDQIRRKGVICQL
ncbi:hypothetical protein EDB86DRAFT_3245024 [Lactarius hatsudake]|nr:hypothetical protein EDB86DRAFT_3245024 [Lactarius hatsudake]